MFKFAVLVLAVAIAQAEPDNFNDEVAAAAQAGDWDEIRKLLASQLEQDATWKALQPEGSVRELKPIKGGHVYGEAEYTYHTASNVDGQTSEKSGGHKLINEDGRISEFDFKPEPNS